MAKTQIDPRAEARPFRADVAPLSPSIRRHLGKSLRSHYAEAMAAPVSERLEALLAKLDPARR